MLCLLLHKLAAAESRLRIDELIRAEGGTTLLALVTISTFCTATRACTGDIAVCEEGL
jgi:hypothetical protein